jgi:hypothetical protein
MLDAAAIINLYNEHKSHDDTLILVFIASYLFHMANISGMGILTCHKESMLVYFDTMDVAAES